MKLEDTYTLSPFADPTFERVAHTDHHSTVLGEHYQSSNSYMQIPDVSVSQHQNKQSLTAQNWRFQLLQMWENVDNRYYRHNFLLKFHFLVYISHCALEWREQPFNGPNENTAAKMRGQPVYNCSSARKNANSGLQCFL